MAFEILQHDRSLTLVQRREAMAYHFPLHSFHLQLPHLIGQARWSIQPVTCVATVRVQLRAFRFGFREFDAAADAERSGGDQQPRSRSHVVSRKYAACPGVSSTPIWIARIPSIPSLCSSRRTSPTRYRASSSAELWTMGRSNTSDRGNRNSSCS